MPPSGNPYVDVPLDLGRKNIRLVTLQPGGTSGPIKCILQSHALDECPAYVALSYAWGDKYRYRNILINGSSFLVGRNLWHFLHQMRMQRQHVLFWIDAISIDQANVFEQNHQVQMMREIYTQACSVWIWLGEVDGYTSSDIAMRYLNTRLAFSSKNVGLKRSFKLWDAYQEEGILELCQRQYWQRIWIVQEVLLATEVKILCGGLCVDWMKLQELLEDLQALAYKPRGKRNVLSSPAAVIIGAKAQWNGHPQPLALLLKRYRKQHSTDVRDKVYALHGLASDSDAIAIDYNIDPKELLVQIINHVYSQQASEMDTRRSERGIFDFAKLMRKSLKVSCDTDELAHIVSLAQGDCSPSAIHQTTECISVVPVPQNSVEDARPVKQKLTDLDHAITAYSNVKIKECARMCQYRGDTAYFGRDVRGMMDYIICDDRDLGELIDQWLQGGSRTPPNPDNIRKPVF
ncbi:hypothetical protein J4E81_006372 [Alternaria sp. BMP 2799]|nr:hypothetical protein J4E81_006372 [Alternaria sp. BMP 2799]